MNKVLMKFFKILLQIILMCLCFLAGMQYERTILDREKNDINETNTPIQEDIIRDEVIDVVPISEENINSDTFDNPSIENVDVSDVDTKPSATNNGEIINTNSNNNIESDVTTTEEPVIIINDINEISDNANNDTPINEQELTPQMFDDKSEN